MTSPDTTAPPKEIPRITEKHVKHFNDIVKAKCQSCYEIIANLEAQSSGSLIPVKREDLEALIAKADASRSVGSDIGVLSAFVKSVRDWLSSVTAGGER